MPSVSRNLVQIAVLHRAGMKRSDLIVIDVGGDESLGSEFTLHVAHVATGNAQFFQVLPVRSEVIADGGHRVWIITKQVQVAGNIACDSTKFTPHLGDQERDVQNVHLIGQYMIFELVGKHHDGVKGQRSTNQGGHHISRD